MPTTFLVVTVIGSLVVLNALRPIRSGPLVASSFGLGWLTAELAPQHLFGHVVVGAYFVLRGAVHGWQGWLALALSILETVGLAYLVVVAQRSRGVMEDALCASLGADYQRKILPTFSDSYDLRVPWRQLVLPLMGMRHPDVERRRGIQYGPHGRRNRLNVYRNKAHPAGAPVLLQIHGGGWVIGNKDQQGIPLMLHLAAKGWVCVAPNYRLSPRATFPDHLVDLKQALAWVREHIHEFGGDPDFVVVTGGSAGGHLTALMALTANDPEYQPGFEGADTSVQAAVPYYGVYDFTNTVGMRAVGDRNRFLIERLVLKQRYRDAVEAFQKASPLHRVRADAPPMFVIHGRHDSLVPVEEARLFVERLREASDEVVVFAELPGTQHAFDVFPSIRTAHVIRAVQRFVDYVYSGYLNERTEQSESEGVL